MSPTETDALIERLQARADARFAALVDEARSMRIPEPEAWARAPDHVASVEISLTDLQALLGVGAAARAEVQKADDHFLEAMDQIRELKVQLTAISSEAVCAGMAQDLGEAATMLWDIFDIAERALGHEGIPAEQRPKLAEARPTKHDALKAVAAMHDALVDARHQLEVYEQEATGEGFNSPELNSILAGAEAFYFSHVLPSVFDEPSAQAREVLDDVIEFIESVDTTSYTLKSVRALRASMDFVSPPAMRFENLLRNRDAWAERGADQLAAIEHNTMSDTVGDKLIRVWRSEAERALRALPAPGAAAMQALFERLRTADKSGDDDEIVPIVHYVLTKYDKLTRPAEAQKPQPEA